MKGKFRWYYSTMGGSKSATLLMKQHQFNESGIETILMKPDIDTRDVGVIKSRAIGEAKRCFVFSESVNVYSMLENIIKNNQTKGVYDSKSTTDTVVFIDEIQFATPEQIKQLWMFTKDYKIDVYVFGLKTTASNKLFDSVPNLFIYADSIEELKSKCKRCKNKATTHLKFVDDVPVMNHDNDIEVGDVVGYVRYESLCQSCRESIIEKQKDTYVNSFKRRDLC